MQYVINWMYIAYWYMPIYTSYLPLRRTIQLRKEWRLIYSSFSSPHSSYHFLPASNAVNKPGEHSAPTVYAEARLDGAVTLHLTVGKVAKASALQLPLLPLPLLLVPPLLAPLPLVPAGIFRTSFQEISSIKCFCTWTISLVLLEGSSLTTPSSPPLSFSLVSETPETMPQGRRRSQPFSARLPTKPLVMITTLRFRYYYLFSNTSFKFSWKTIENTNNLFLNYFNLFNKWCTRKMDKGN